VDPLVEALDEMAGAAPTKEQDGRARIDVDRSFTIKGAGTVITGTLTGGEIAVGEEVSILPSGSKARVRSLQTHRRGLEVARPVSRVAANLAGIQVDEVGRGDVLVQPGSWRPTAAIDVQLRTVRSLAHPLTARGAYKLYAGTAERDARLKLHEGTSIQPGADGFARLRLSAPIVAAAGDSFVLREAGRRETVGGGVILDPHPQRRLAGDVVSRLNTRLHADPGELPAILVAERGAVRVTELGLLAGSTPSSIPGAAPTGGWWVSAPLREEIEKAATGALERLHSSSPFLPGIDAADLRASVVEGLDRETEEVVGAILTDMETRGVIQRSGTLLRLAGHSVSLGERQKEADALLQRIAEGEPTPPTRPDLLTHGFDDALIDACVTTGLLARISPDLLLTPGFLAAAEKLAREEAGSPQGLTVSRFRELLGTTRKYALPILGSFDERGITIREGDVRRLRD
jgi:selenocysteine-specific elongation factor